MYSDGLRVHLSAVLELWIRTRIFQKVMPCDRKLQNRDSMNFVLRLSIDLMMSLKPKAGFLADSC